ncbi:hypothetical protein GCM10009676_46600 [Prauserella halophila]|uniref:DUF1648 domain-containing protein n=1 Tax=Prauserella halophila TaxID=185641 RepID=A0ABP4H8U4_9PSEU|nr:DUF1648 domain-containing protein [Prauserella halophila]MCP2237955.1 hypothetical protein [Prauserella halophila]
MKTTRLALAGGAVPLAVLGGTWALQAAWADRLPDVVAAHWGLTGPDRSAELSTMTGVTLGIGAVLTLVTLVTVLVSRLRGAVVPRSAVGFVAWLATLPAGVLAGSMYAALDATSWRDAGPAWSAVGWALGLSVAAGAAATLVAGPTERPAPAEPRDLPSAGLQPGERASWIGGGTNYPMAFGGLVAVLGYALLHVSIPGLGVMPFALAVLVVVLAMAAVCRVRVRVDTTGVTLSLGLFGFPNRTLTYDEIASANTEEMTMGSAGGYGLRRGVGYTAFKVRAGETLTITLNSGHVVKATVDHADRAAGLVNDLTGARDGA